jgi:hypothetical protein
LHDKLAAISIPPRVPSVLRSFFSLLQLARQRAGAVVVECPDLHDERQSAGAEVPELDRVVAKNGSRVVPSRFSILLVFGDADHLSEVGRLFSNAALAR